MFFIGRRHLSDSKISFKSIVSRHTRFRGFKGASPGVTDFKAFKWVFKGEKICIPNGKLSQVFVVFFLSYGRRNKQPKSYRRCHMPVICVQLALTDLRNECQDFPSLCLIEPTQTRPRFNVCPKDEGNGTAFGGIEPRTSHTRHTRLTNKLKRNFY